MFLFLRNSRCRDNKSLAVGSEKTFWLKDSYLLEFPSVVWLKKYYIVSLNQHGKIPPTIFACNVLAAKEFYNFISTRAGFIFENVYLLLRRNHEQKKNWIPALDSNKIADNYLTGKRVVTISSVMPSCIENVMQNIKKLQHFCMLHQIYNNNQLIICKQNCNLLALHFERQNKYHLRKGIVQNFTIEKGVK